MALIPILDHLKNSAEAHIKELEEALRKAEAARQRLQKIAKTGQLYYRVELVDIIGPAIGTSTTTRGSLKQALARAHAEFKKANHGKKRSYNHCRVFAILPGKPQAESKLPDIYWCHYLPKK